MGLYARYVLPRLVHYSCSRPPQLRRRAAVVPQAEGVVLEIGFGSGLNLPWYDASKVTRVLALEPSDDMWALAAPAAQTASVPVERLPSPAEELSLPEASLDSAVVTYTLCTLPDAVGALEKLRRALKPGARLLFAEHGAAPDAAVRRWQDRLDGIWSRFAGGCHLNRPIPALLEASGFRIAEMESRYHRGWKPANFNYWGAATST